MARFYPALEDKHRDFIAAQKIFFTASGTATGRLNLSPKGMDSLRVLSPSRVAYLDLTGSVPGIDATKFQACAEDAKANCPISQLLRSVPITLSAKLG